MHTSVTDIYMSPVSPVFHTVESVRLPFHSKLFYLEKEFNNKIGWLSVRYPGKLLVAFSGPNIPPPVNQAMSI